MSLSKTLTSAVAAVTVAGAVGLAYAQSTPDTSTTPAPANADTSQPVSNTTPSADNSSNTYVAPSTDLEPKADRN
ncbi:MAG: hypothetical protein K8R60_08885 [Burkholderiales bacterium]|nr:hypothetical protein [Burkholderiales bacterium]